MGKRTNEAFIQEYSELDKLCLKKFGVEKMGVTEYITRLNNARFAPSRDDVLPRLVRLRNLKNSVTHNEDARPSPSEITKSDIKWLHSFSRSVEKKRDPLSLYLKRAYRHARLRKARKILVVAFLVAVAIAAGVVAVMAFI